MNLPTRTLSMYPSCTHLCLHPQHPQQNEYSFDPTENCKIEFSFQVWHVCLKFSLKYLSRSLFSLKYFAIKFSSESLYSLLLYFSVHLIRAWKTFSLNFFFAINWIRSYFFRALFSSLKSFRLKYFAEVTWAKPPPPRKWG